MTGIVGGAVTGTALRDLLADMHSEAWYDRVRLEAAPFGIGLVTHGDRDPGGSTAVDAGSTVGAVHGAITNLPRLGWSHEEACRRVIEDPTGTLPALDGPFLIVTADADTGRLVVATDKLGTRRCHYVDDGRFLFGTSVAPLLAGVPEPTVDPRGVTDLVAVGQVWGGRTLVSEVSSMPPGAALVYEEGEVTVQRYWRHGPDAGDPPTTRKLAEEYRRAVRDVAATIGEGPEVGLWLSGGLDSRTLAAELSRHHDLRTYTYDANPPTGDNPELAGRVAELLGISNEPARLAADGFVPALGEGVAAVDGMVPWATFMNVAATYGLEHQPDLLFEGSGQGGLLGNDVWRSDLERANSPADALYRSQHAVTPDAARDLLAVDVDPMRTYREETAASDAGGFDGRVIEAYRRNFYPYGEFASNAVTRTQAGTRVPVADGDFLQLVSRIPREARTRAVPFTRGRVPYGTARYKLGLTRELDGGLELVPYERTGVAPVRPLWQHAAGFVVTTAIARLRGEATYGGGTLAGQWYRENRRLRTRVDGLVDDVCDRPWVNEDAVRDRQLAHLAGEEDYSTPLSALTTAELWFQSTLDR